MSVLSSDSSNPSVPERVIRHRWEGTKYSRADGNFSQWTEKLKDALILNGLYGHVFDISARPKADYEPRAYANWGLNDRLAIIFIKTALDDAEHRDLVTDSGAAYCFTDLKTRAQREGPIKQIALLQEALSTYCSTTEPLPITAGRIADTVKRAFDIGDVTQDLFTCIALLNSLNDPSFESLQNSVSTLLSKSTRDAPCNPTDIRLLMENAQNIINAKAKSVHATALSAKGGGKHRDTDLPGHNHGPGATCCENCFSLKRSCWGHTKPFCVQKGGGMAGKSIAEAQEAKRAQRKKADTQKGTPDKPTISAKSFVAVTGLDGKLWYVDPTQLGQLPSPPETASFANVATSCEEPHSNQSTEYWEHVGFTAIDEARTTIDWNTHTKEITESILAVNVSPLTGAKRAPLTALDSTPFLVDSGATVHISPYRNDFISLRPIPPRHVKGLGGSTVAAVGVGDIRLHIAKGADMILRDALYIPNAMVRLVSVSSLATLSGLDSAFDDTSVKIIDRSTRTIVARGPLIPDQRLYRLNLDSATSQHHAFSLQHATNLETWHRRLGHANYQTVRDMAKSGMVPGMPSVFSSTPPKCNSCILGKQTRNTVPKVREEGRKATRRLEIVWVDLTGPQAVVSCNGYKYIMNVVDDFTSEHWSILLRNKAEAFTHLKAWQTARENEIQGKLGTYRTGHDGELVGHKMEAWLLSQGSEQQFGAAYTSAHIGRVERMHRTLMGKARAMRIAAGCPPNMWDEFYMTASHLHKRTLTKSLENITPHEAWTGRRPDYSYMREIGCKAFVLILAEHNPKIYARSIECILIGYAKGSKAYRCYEKATGKIYETYHVKFCESHEDGPLPTSPISDITVSNQHTTPDTRDPIILDDDATVQPGNIPPPHHELDEQLTNWKYGYRSVRPYLSVMR